MSNSEVRLNQARGINSTGLQRRSRRPSMPYSKSGMRSCASRPNTAPFRSASSGPLPGAKPVRTATSIFSWLGERGPVSWT